MRGGAGGGAGLVGARRRPESTEVAGGPHLQVLLDAAGQGAHLAVAEEGDLVVGDALEEVAVVGDDDEGAREGVEQVLHRGQGVGIEVVRGLVEEQHVRLAHEQAHELEAATLAARDFADARVGTGPREAHALRHLRGADLLAVHDDGLGDVGDGLDDAHVG